MAIKYQPIYIAGPTASGKSALAIELAKRLDSVIISADSMQIYKGLDVGTAKESAQIRAIYPHKMIDIVDADKEFSVAEFANIAKIEIEKAQNDGKLPIIVGGTGLYFEALLYPMSFGNTIKNDELRQQLKLELENFGAAELHKKLEKLDFETAKRLHENDTKRVMRALEIVLTTGKTLAESEDKRENPDVIMVALDTERAVLYDKINRRVDKMFDDGLVEEVFSVGNFGYQSMQAIGYKEFSDCEYSIEDGKIVIDDKTLGEIKEKIKQHTRNYAKRQLTWFRKYDFVRWFDAQKPQEALDYLLEKIKEKSSQNAANNQ